MKNKGSGLLTDPGTSPIVLASQSPRRAYLLQLIGFEFLIQPAQVDETKFSEPDPAKHVLQLSYLKASNVGDVRTDGLIIGADTIVVLDGEILGKPADANEAVNMLKRLSGKTHRVYTGFTLLRADNNHSVSDFEVTRVHFRDLNDDEISSYVDTGNPMDKAGAYGIQDQSAVFVDRIDGCFYNVVGFPLAKFYKVFMKFE
ncbi:septum formation inhibitor Maf [candidate division KSB1 bacterium]|nr:septum formation inhibitor Maf [candidate division KSB1 bacterium]